MEPQAGSRVSPFRVTKRSNDFLRKTTRRSRVHVQTIGLNAETKKCRHRADGEICLLTFPFIGLLRLVRPSLTPRQKYYCRTLEVRVIVKGYEGEPIHEGTIYKNSNNGSSGAGAIERSKGPEDFGHHKPGR